MSGAADAITPHDDVRPTVREQLEAVFWAALCAVLFLGAGLLPGRAVLPFPPAALDPAFAELAPDARAPVLRGNAAMGDKYNQSLAWDRITQDALRQGRLPLWTRDIGGGAPFVPQMGQIYQPWTLLLGLLPSTEVYGLWFCLHQIILGWLCYRFLRRLGTRHTSALIGVVAMTIGLWTQARIHHNVILTAVLPAFGMLACTHELCARRGGAGTAALLALGTGLSWLGGMPQISLLVTYTTIAWALTLTFLGARGHRRAGLAWTACGLVLGAMLSLLQMGPVLLAAQLSARTAATTAELTMATLESNHLLTLFWPDLLAWPSDVFYGSIEATRPPWQALLQLDYQRVLGAHCTWPETAFAVGIPTLACALGGVWYRQRLAAGFFTALVVVGLVAATGSAGFPSLVQALPGAAAGDLRRWLVLCALGLPVLAALGADRWLERGPGMAFVGCGALAMVSAVLAARVPNSADTLTNRTVPALASVYAQATGAQDSHALEPAVLAAIAPGEAEVNRDRLVVTYGRAALVASLTCLLLLLWRRRSTVARGLALLAALELAHAGAGTIVAEPSSRLVLPNLLAPIAASPPSTDGVRPRFQRLAAEGDQRRAPLYRPNLPGFFGIEDLGAYQPLAPLRLEQLWTAIEPDRPGKTKIALGGSGVDLLRDPDSLRHPLLDVLGLTWVLTARPLTGPGLIDRTPLGTPAPFHLYERTTCLARATFITDVKIEKDSAARLALLADPGRDARRQMLLEATDAPRATPSDAVAKVEVVTHQDERVVLRVRNEAAGYVRLADPWDPGWTATVNGSPAPVWVADHFLRAVFLAPGNHEVEFRYDGWIVKAPRWSATLSLVGIALLGLVGWRRSSPARFRKQPVASPAQS